MRLKTRITDMLGIEHPIVQGGMHLVSCAELCIAICEAGCLGTLTALSNGSPENLRREIRKVREKTSKPMCVNLTLLPALSPPNYADYVEVIISEKVPICETAGRSPWQYIKMLKEGGVLVIHKCTAVRHALTAERLGADILSVDGFECAGHPGEGDVGNFVLLAAAARKLRVPFIASGGVGTGSQIAAAIALGAEGVNIGTRFMTTVESPIHENIKRAIVDSDENATTLVLKTLKNTERVYKNEAARQVQEIEKEYPGDITKIRHIVSGENYRKSFHETGDTTNSIWSAGQVMGLIDDVPTCAVLVERLVRDACQTLTSGSRRVIDAGAPRPRL